MANRVSWKHAHTYLKTYEDVGNAGAKEKKGCYNCVALNPDSSAYTNGAMELDTNDIANCANCAAQTVLCSLG